MNEAFPINAQIFGVFWPIFITAFLGSILYFVDCAKNTWNILVPGPSLCRNLYEQSNNVPVTYPAKIIWPIIHRLVITDKNGIFSYISLIFQKSNPVDAKFTVLALEPVGRT